jgi:phosphoribosyl-ATP pyrophosphohydrolase/phosphoribosyl-AMP cyclohydrolase
MTYQILDQLAEIIKERKENPQEDSYISGLFQEGINKIAQKVGEEGVETAIAAIAEDDKRLISESADLIFHLQILLEQRNIPLQEITKELESRNKQ